MAQRDKLYDNIKIVVVVVVVVLVEVVVVVVVVIYKRNNNIKVETPDGKKCLIKNMMNCKWKQVF